MGMRRGGDQEIHDPTPGPTAYAYGCGCGCGCDAAIAHRHGLIDGQGITMLLKDAESVQAFRAGVRGLGNEDTEVQLQR